MHERDGQKREGRGRVLLVGHCCHDSIRTPAGAVFEALGGSVAYISNILDALHIPLQLISKVGSDFAYSSLLLPHPPSFSLSAPTTQFFSDFTLIDDRVLKTGHLCEPIFPHDVPMHFPRYPIGLAVGVACEISAETLGKMADACELLVVDVQALIRTIDPATGLVGLQRLSQTPFQRLLHRVSYLKAARNEALYIDIEDVRKDTVVIVTQGKLGCSIYCKDHKFTVPAFEAEEVDPTGAGDSFLAGFSAGLYQGFSVQNAALMGNYFGAVTVGQVGVPTFSSTDLQKMQRSRLLTRQKIWSLVRGLLILRCSRLSHTHELQSLVKML
ncbi:hypothetical protein GOP47_0016659 [Adiantum capillus-veneris]|uniref:Carbohydrate kinase PfkB domain-containing protein n=1 Tax=Adiantum capillus-veneris TaxID=13818 RepID=A0A9D4UI36_ADICA|nr:hypothetical protein GOP47_0016659 [Adiantum capillus-veneris]